MDSKNEQTFRSIEGDPDSAAILARRKKLIALALSGAASLGMCACTKSISLTHDASVTIDADIAIDETDIGETDLADSSRLSGTDSAAVSGTDSGRQGKDTLSSDTDLCTDSGGGCGCVSCGCGCHGCGCGCGTG